MRYANGVLACVIWVGSCLIIQGQAWHQGKQAGYAQALEDKHSEIVIGESALGEEMAVRQAQASTDHECQELKEERASLGAMLHIMTQMDKCFDDHQQACDHLCADHITAFCGQNVSHIDWLRVARDYQKSLCTSQDSACDL